MIEPSKLSNKSNKSAPLQADDSNPAHHPTHDDASFKPFLSEFVGSFLLVHLTQCGLTAFELTGTQNDTVSRQAATLIIYGLAFMLATLLTLNTSGAHLNPAYSFASACFGRLSWRRASNYLAAQYSGAFLAAILVHATYNDKVHQRHSEGLLSGANSTHRAHGDALSTGKFFTSFPPTEVSLFQLTISYTLASAHLMLLLAAIQEAKLIKSPQSMKPIFMAATLVLVQAAFSANGGPVLNPAQDFSPRLYISMFGWGSAAFNPYHFTYWWLCGLFAPHLGALVGFALHKLLVHTVEAKGAARIRGHNKLTYALPSDYHGITCSMINR